MSDEYIHAEAIELPWLQMNAANLLPSPAGTLARSLLCPPSTRAASADSIARYQTEGWNRQHRLQVQYKVDEAQAEKVLPSLHATIQNLEKGCVNYLVEITSNKKLTWPVLRYPKVRQIHTNNIENEKSPFTEWKLEMGSADILSPAAIARIHAHINRQ